MIPRRTRWSQYLAWRSCAPELADVEDIVHVCHAGGISNINMKGIVRHLLENHKFSRKAESVAE